MASSSRRVLFSFLVTTVSLTISTSLCAQESDFTRTLDLVYHKQDGYALTMDRVAPTARANGAAIVMVLSGRWVSRHEFLAPAAANQLPQITADSAFNPTELLARGYTVFFVVHGAAPMFTIPEIDAQLGEALNHIRTHADRYKIDSKRIGMVGASAGGHLSLLRGTAAVEGRPQAIVAYFPPTDFVNYGGPNSFFVDYMEGQVAKDGFNRFTQALELIDHEPDRFLRTKVTDPDRLARHYRDISPYYHVTADDPPTLLLHGDADQTVPIQQSERIAKKFDAAGVPYRLHVKQGGAHGWEPDAAELKTIADWFDTYLK